MPANIKADAIRGMGEGFIDCEFLGVFKPRHDYGGKCALIEAFVL